MSDSLRLHGLSSPWNSPGQNTGVGSLSLLQGKANLSLVPESRGMVPGGVGEGQERGSLKAQRKLLGMMDCSLS